MNNTEPETIGLLDKRMSKHMDVFRIVLVHAAEETPLPEILEVFGKDLAIKFLDIFAGATIVVPSREVITNAARDVDIYLTIKRTPDNRTEKIEAYNALADRYDLEAWYVKELYNKLEGMLDEHYSPIVLG